MSDILDLLTPAQRKRVNATMADILVDVLQDDLGWELAEEVVKSKRKELKAMIVKQLKDVDLDKLAKNYVTKKMLSL